MISIIGVRVRMRSMLIEDIKVKIIGLILLWNGIDIDHIAESLIYN